MDNLNMDPMSSSVEDTPKSPDTPSSAVGITSFQGLSILIAMIVTASVSFIAGVIFERQQGLASADEFVVFWEAWDLIDDDYFFTERLPDDEQRVYGAIEGFVNTLEDPNTRFFPPVQAETSREDIAGQFGGIGAQVAVTEAGEPFIVAIIADECIAVTPADRAGLQADDIIRAVDGDSVEGLTLDMVVERVRGQSGTTVTLTVYRPESDETLDIDIERGNVENITVTAEIVDDIAYMNLSIFNALATRQMLCKLDSVLDQNPQALILDLNGNPGGLLDQALLVADLFLDEGPVLIQRDRAGNEEQIFSDDGDIAEDIPLYVVVNGGSASASEVVAGAFQDRDRAVLIGQTTFGKGSVQNVYELSDGSELRITAAAWFTPGNQRIEGNGLTPDFVVDCEGLDAIQCNALNVESAFEFVTDDLSIDTDDTTASLLEGVASILNPIIQTEVVQS